MPKIKFKQHVENADGWTDWVHPKMKGYRIKCCDCGLVHKFEFRVTRITRRRKGGWKIITLEDDPNLEIEFRATRTNLK